MFVLYLLILLVIVCALVPYFTGFSAAGKQIYFSLFIVYESNNNIGGRRRQV